MKAKTPRAKRIVRCVLLCLLAALVPPLFVGITFHIGEVSPVIVVPWSAGDALAYCGGIATAVIAIIGVVYSLQDNRESDEQQIREGSAPFFSAVILTQHNQKTLFSELLANHLRESEETDNITEAGQLPSYSESEDRRLYAIMGNKTTYRNRLTDEQREHVESKFLIEHAPDSATYEVVNPVIYVPLRLKNIGPGSASCVRVGVIRPDEEWRGACSWTIEHGDDFYLGIYVDTSRAEVFGKYLISIVFDDCLGYKYREDFGLTVSEPTLIRPTDRVARPQVGFSYTGTRTLIDKSQREKYLASAELIIKTEVPHQQP